MVSEQSRKLSYSMSSGRSNRPSSAITAMRRILALLVVAFSLVACSPSDLVAQDPGRKCADVFARSYTTDGVVNGTWACFDKDRQNVFHTYGIDGDKALSGPASVHHQQFVAHDLHTPKGDSYIYRIWESDSKGNVVLGTYMIVYTDSSGKVHSWSLAQ